MPDIIQESYNIVNHFLGKPNRSGQIRVPEEHENLVHAIQRLVQYSYRTGKSAGAKECVSTVKEFADGLHSIPAELYDNPYLKMKEETEKK